MEDSQQQLVLYLQDAHATELGISLMLQEVMDEQASNENVSALFRSYYNLTDEHTLKLELRLRDLGGEPSAGKGFFKVLLSKIDEMMNSVSDIHDRSTHNLIKCYAAQHFEQGMYSSLATYAEASGDQETVSLAEGLNAEVEEAALKFYPMIEICAQRTFNARTRDVN